MSNKDYYSILCVDKNASEDEIKKSYRKLALLYHPDKNQGNDEACKMACEKFKDVSEAYSILGDKNKRSDYDSYGIIDGEQFGGEDPFQHFNEIFKDHINNFMNMKYENDININNIFNNIPGMEGSTSFPFSNIHVKVHTFPTDIFNGENIKDQYDDYEDEYKKENSSPFSMNGIFNTLFSKEKSSEKEVKILYNKPDPIIYDIHVSLEDIYRNEKKKISISRYRLKNGKKIKKIKNISIPIYCKEVFLEGEGNELKDYKEKGDIIINIYNKINENIDFKRVNEYDVLTYKSIKVSDIYNPFIYELTLPHGKILNIQSEKLTGKDHLIQKILGKGLPYKNDSGNKSFGNLYVIYKVIFPNDFNDIIEKEKENENEKECENKNIKDDLLVAYNCDFNEIFNSE